MYIHRSSLLTVSAAEPKGNFRIHVITASSETRRCAGIEAGISYAWSEAGASCGCFEISPERTSGEGGSIPSEHRAFVALE